MPSLAVINSPLLRSMASPRVPCVMQYVKRVFLTHTCWIIHSWLLPENGATCHTWRESMAMIQIFLRRSIDFQKSVATTVFRLLLDLFSRGFRKEWLLRDKPRTTDALKGKIRNEVRQIDSTTLGRCIDNMQRRIQIYLADGVTSLPAHREMSVFST